MELIDPPDGRPWALIGIAGASLLLNVVLGVALVWPTGDAPPEPDVAIAEPVAEPAAAAAEGDAVVDGAAIETPTEDDVPAVEEAPPALPEGLRVRDTATHRFWFNYDSAPVSYEGRDIPAAGVHWEEI